MGLHRIAHGTRFAPAVPTRHVYGAVWVPANGGNPGVTLALLVAGAPAFVAVQRVAGPPSNAVLELPSNLFCDLSVVGAGGLNEAVGVNRAYALRIVASDDGSQVALFGVRINTLFALPAGFAWASDPLAPIVTTGNAGGNELFPYLDNFNGFYAFTTAPPVALVTTGPATVPIDLQGAPLNNQEVVDDAVYQVRLAVVAGANAGATDGSLVIAPPLGSEESLFRVIPDSVGGVGCERQVYATVAGASKTINATFFTAGGGGGPPAGGSAGISVNGIWF